MLLLEDLPRIPSDWAVRVALGQLEIGRGLLFFGEDQAFSRVGVHWSNMTVEVEADGDVAVTCAFCAMVKHVIDTRLEEGKAYHQRRDEMLDELEQRLIDQGVEATAARWQATAQLDETMRESDELYARDLVFDNA